MSCQSILLNKYYFYTIIKKYCSTQGLGLSTRFNNLCSLCISINKPPQCKVIDAYGHHFAHGCAFNWGQLNKHDSVVSVLAELHTDLKENLLPQKLLLLLCPIFLRKMLGFCLINVAATSTLISSGMMMSSEQI